MQLMLLIKEKDETKLEANEEKKKHPTQMKSVRKMSEVMMQSAPRPIAACEFLVYSNSVALELVET